VPDIVLPSIYDHAEVGESSLDNPLPWDTIAPAPYDKLNRVEPVLPELRRRSDSRLASDADFAFLREEIERFKKKQAEKSVSLNEAQRLKEKNEAAERAKARKKELASRPEPPGKTYEITLKNAEQPGLPAPVTKTNSVKTAAAATNATTNATAQVAQKGEDDPDEVVPDEKLSNVDMAMEEAKRILIDYLTLTRGNSIAGTTPSNGIN
jgi:carboxyl-terminal processing protease